MEAKVRLPDITSLLNTCGVLGQDFGISAVSADHVSSFFFFKFDSVVRLFRTREHHLVFFSIFPYFYCYFFVYHRRNLSGPGSGSSGAGGSLFPERDAVELGLLQDGGVLFEHSYFLEKGE